MVDSNGVEVLVGDRVMIVNEYLAKWAGHSGIVEHEDDHGTITLSNRCYNALWVFHDEISLPVAVAIARSRTK